MSADTLLDLEVLVNARTRKCSPKASDCLMAVLDRTCTRIGRRMLRADVSHCFVASCTCNETVD
jgi:hypothetical protein